jgi:SAM-dependent methyltransferase
LVPELKRFLQINDSPDKVIVDFGCGLKPFGYLFENFQGNYVGLDVYPGERVDIVYDGKDIPLGTKTVDLVFSQSVFECVEEIEYTFREICRILRAGGKLIAVTPFINHVHGAPFDYHRPTRYGWEALIKKTFSKNTRYEVVPVDGRFNCLINMITAQMNLALLDLMRWGSKLFGRKVTTEKSLYAGSASPESHDNLGMKLAYTICNLNPLNFLLGMFSWMVSQPRLNSRRPVGEITSGYLIKVWKNE